MPLRMTLANSSLIMWSQYTVWIWSCNCGNIKTWITERNMPII